MTKWRTSFVLFMLDLLAPNKQILHNLRLINGRIHVHAESPVLFSGECKVMCDNDEEIYYIKDQGGKEGGQRTIIYKDGTVEDQKYENGEWIGGQKFSSNGIMGRGINQ